MGRGEKGSEPPENRKNIGSLSNTGTDSLKNRKATCNKPTLHLNVGPSSAHQQNAIFIQVFSWRFAGGPIMAHLSRYSNPFPRIN